MIAHFLLPDLGEGLPEAELVQWMVGVGDTVSLNQCIAEVETAKAVVELPSPHAGVVQALHADAGDVVAVGTPLISYELENEIEVEVAADRGTVMDAEAAGSAEMAPPNLVGYGPAATPSARPARRPRRSAMVTAQRPSLPAPAAAPVAERPRSTPPVRKFAKDHGIDLAQVAAASGTVGVITRADVEAFASRATPPDDDAAPARPDDMRDRTTRTPIRGVRKLTAEAMVQSAFTAPHVTIFLTVDVTHTMRLIDSLKSDRDAPDHRIGVLAVAAKAACLALGASPGLNSAWDEHAAEIVRHHYVNLGIAAATPRGLVVPVIMDAGALTLGELATSIADLARTAREGKTRAVDMSGGTFSITNVGVFGIDAGTPIINPGEAGILALGAVRRTPWEHRGKIALRDVMTLSLSFDHRLVDGQEGSQFLAAVGAILREPGRAMLLR